MTRSLRWTLIMAILGFILGLGFLVRLPSTEARTPASETEPESVFFKPSDETPFSNEIPSLTSQIDDRQNVLFDIHAISQSRFAKNTDAYVFTQFTSSDQSTIESFVKCHNYDFDRQRADTRLGRYTLGEGGYNCYLIRLSALAAGYTLIDTPFGKMLALKSGADFDPNKGGTIAVIFAYRVVKIGQNDYRSLDVHLSLENGVLKVTGPKNETFDWLNLKMSEDVLGLPNGVKAFEFYLKGTKVSEYPGEMFPKPTGLTPDKMSD